MTINIQKPYFKLYFLCFVEHSSFNIFPAINLWTNVVGQMQQKQIKITENHFTLSELNNIRSTKNRYYCKLIFQQESLNDKFEI